MPRDLILFGNSPFLYEINIPALLHHHTVGFNGFGQHQSVDELFVFDRWYDPGKAKRIWHPEHIKSQNAYSSSFVYKSAQKPFLTKQKSENGLPVFAFKYFSPSVAINWALLEQFRAIYLVGIDHIETDTKFQHHDGADCQSQLTPEAHRAFKKYVYSCAQHIEIYQTNPAVRDGWELPFVDIKTLYAF